MVAESSPCDLASVPRTAIDRFLWTRVASGHHARRRPTADLHALPTSVADLNSRYLKYLSRSAMTDSRRFRPTGGLFRSSTEPAKLVPT